MKSYELFLDESGEFKIDEKNPKKNPSLVGGILIKKGALERKAVIKDILQRNDVHMCEISAKSGKEAGDYAIELLGRIKQIAHVVIFENNERLELENDKELYLNIISEGIINLAEKLSLEKADEDIELNVLIATRRDLKFDDPSKKIEKERYDQIILEKIYMRMVEKNLFLSKNFKINIKFASGTKDPYLMLADVVCNTRLTRKSNKFTKEQKVKIEQIFNNSKYMFNVFRSNVQKEISTYISQNNIVDASFKLVELEDGRDKNYLIDLIVNRINGMETDNLRIQIELLSIKIKSLINIQGKLFLVENYLNTLQEKVMRRIKKKDVLISKLNLDISLYLLTIYTHNGNINKCYEKIQESEELLKELNGTWEFLDYYYILKIREAVFYMDCFDFEKVVQTLEEVIERAELVSELIKEIPGCENMTSDVVGKALGTRLQAYTYLIAKDEKYYELAIKDWEKAISQFVSGADKVRQYLYRVNIEVEKGDVKKAIYYLGLSVKENKADFAKILNKIENISGFSKHFSVSAYLKVMATAKEKNDMEIARQMNEALRENKSLFEEYCLNESGKEYNGQKIESKKENLFHPFELIYWNLARYYKNQDNNLAKEYYKKAVNVCDAYKETTLSLVSIAIVCDEIDIIDNPKEAKQELLNRFTTEEQKNIKALEKVINEIKEPIEKIIKKEDKEEIQKQVKEVLKRIKV